MGARYSDEEAQEILRRALERTSDAEVGHRHEILQEAAAEVGIAPETFERIAAEYREERLVAQNLDARRRGRIQAYWRSLGTFGLVNGFLFALDMITSGGTWFYYPLLGWGMFVALRGYRVLLPPSDEAYAKAFAKEKNRLQREHQRQAEQIARVAREAEKRRAKAGKGGELERTIERGVTAFLDALARQIEPGASASAKPPTDFERYVQGKQNPAASPSPERSPVVTPPPAVRAPAPEDEAEELPAGRARKQRR